MLPLPILADKQNRIAFCGPMAAGKTWCANHLEENYGYIKISFADKLKEICNDLYGYTDRNKKYYRTMLQELGDTLRGYDDDVFIKSLFRDIKGIEQRSNYIVVVDDLRFMNEYNLLRKNNFTIIKVTTPIAIRDGRILDLYPEMPATALSHASEGIWESIPADYGIESINPKDTERDLKAIMHKVLKNSNSMVAL